MDEKLPTSAAASAGTMNIVYAIGLRGTIGAMRIPPSPAITDDRAQLLTAMRSGESPVTNAPFSDSAAASVATPNRVKWYTSATTVARATITTASQMRSVGT